MAIKQKEQLDIDVRFLLANERTLLAWIRTGLAVIAAGVAVAFLSEEQVSATVAGIGAIILGGALTIVGYIRYKSADEAIREERLPATGRGGVFVVMSVVGFSLLLTIAKAAGI